MAVRSEGLTLDPIWLAPELRFADGTDARGGLLPPELAARFPGELAVPLRPERPTVIANFVSSLDGVVAMGQRLLGIGPLHDGPAPRHRRRRDRRRGHGPRR